MTLNFRVFFAGLLLLALIGLIVTRTVYAADATLNWTHPTQRVDNTPITLAEIRETQIDWAKCATGNTFPASPLGTKAVPAPATSTVVTGLDYGTWCFRARSVDTAGEMSLNSGTVWKQYLAPPKPPVLSAVITVAYEIKSHPLEGQVLGRAVGTVALGTECGTEPIVYGGNGVYYEVALDKVTLTKMPKSAVVVTKCEVG